MNLNNWDFKGWMRALGMGALLTGNYGLLVPFLVSASSDLMVLGGVVALLAGIPATVGYVRWEDKKARQRVDMERALAEEGERIKRIEASLDRELNL